MIPTPEQRAEWRRPCDPKYAHGRILTLLDALDEIEAVTLHAAASELDRRMQTFPQNGRHTRAGWAVNALRHMADQRWRGIAR
jgi:hypothetical protein